MKILFISPYLPHPLSGHGGGVYLYHLLEKLSPRHELTLISFCDERELELARDLATLPIRTHFVPRTKGEQPTRAKTALLMFRRGLKLLSSIMYWEPYYVCKYRDRGMSGLVRDLTSREQFDIVQVEYAQMGIFLPDIRSGKTILHEIDVNFRPAFRRYNRARSPIRKLAMLVEWCRWSRFEKQLALRFDHILAITDQDRRLMKWLSDAERHASRNTDRISYLPHGYDVVPVLPAYSMREARSMMFMGSFLHPPNVDAATLLCEKIFPLVARQFPDAVLYVVGGHVPASVKAAAKPYPGIKIMGFVEDVEEYLRRATVFIAPMRFGGGVKTKVIHAMSQGIAVVASKVAIEGIDGMQPDTVLVGDAPERLADQVCELFRNGQGETYGARGWNLIRTWYSWDIASAKLEETYQQLLAVPSHGADQD